MYFDALTTISRPDFAAARRLARRILDAPFCASALNVRPYGKENVWHICTEGWRDRRPVVYSGGVGKDISTELELLSSFDCSIFLYDPSPTGQATMQKAENQRPGLSYKPSGFAGRPGPITFSLPSNAAEGSFSSRAGSGPTVDFDCVRLSEQAQLRGHREIDLVKLDIEGFEYEVLDDLLASTLSVHQICVEFHPWLSKHCARETAKAMRKLRREGFRIIYKHGSDYTFYRPTATRG
jgi:FkbM family methyltransferase